jgi:hypothetical protein
MQMTRPILPKGTTLRAFVDGADWSGFNAAVSLHAHTSYSREVLSDLPAYIERIPIVGLRFRREMADRADAEGAAVDFSKGWWHPPASPGAVFESEAAQIDRCFGLRSIVSVTDHDDIAAGVELQQLYAPGRAPISFEWTVPYGPGFFHLGVHNLPAGSAADWFARLSTFTRGTRGDDLRAILADLNARPDLLIVFNHPLWDLAGVGERTHTTDLRRFLSEHGSEVHALEVNGYRSRGENGRVRSLSATTGLPLISGGDRHALAPNAVLNATRARSFAEFADEVRHGLSHVVVMPEYRRHIVARKLAAASDVLKRYRTHPVDRQRWIDRVSCDWRGSVRPLSHHWPTGGPMWVRSSIAAFRMLASPVVLPIVTVALERTDRSAAGPVPMNS